MATPRPQLREDYLLRVCDVINWDDWHDEVNQLLLWALPRLPPHSPEKHIEHITAAIAQLTHIMLETEVGKLDRAHARARAKAIAAQPQN